jgi:hypothetical protein
MRRVFFGGRWPAQKIFLHHSWEAQSTSVSIRQTGSIFPFLLWDPSVLFS